MPYMVNHFRESWEVPMTSIPCIYRERVSKATQFKVVITRTENCVITKCLIWLTILGNPGKFL